MQRGCLSNTGCSNGASRNAARFDFPEIDLDVVRLSGERRIDQAIHSRKGGVGRHCHHIRHIDAPLVQSIERELFDLRTRGAAIAADQRHQQRAGAGRYRHSGAAHLFIDEASEVARGGSEWESLKATFLKKNAFEEPFFKNDGLRMVRIRPRRVSYANALRDRFKAEA